MENIKKIKNTIDFLQKTNPDALNELKKKFPANTEILEGKEKYGAEDNADTPEKRSAVLAVSIKALQNAENEITPMLNSLRKKLSLANNIRFISSVLSTIGSGTLATMIIANFKEFQLITAIITFITSFLPLVVNKMEASKYGGGENNKMVDYLDRMNTLIARTKNLKRMLEKDLELNNYDNDTIKNIKDTDEVFSELGDIKEKII